MIVLRTFALAFLQLVQAFGVTESGTFLLLPGGSHSNSLRPDWLDDAGLEIVGFVGFADEGCISRIDRFREVSVTIERDM